jgi:hypothetical protein
MTPYLKRTNIHAFVTEHTIKNISVSSLMISMPRHRRQSEPMFNFIFSAPDAQLSLTFLNT